MVYKAIKVTKEVMERHRYCDVCGDEINIELVCCTVRCAYCGRDLCEKHIGHEIDYGHDTRTVYCKSCWNLGEPYRPRIEELQDKTARLYKEWQDKCKENSTE